MLVLPLNSQFPETVESIRASLRSDMVIRKMVPKENQEKLNGDLTIKLFRLYGLEETGSVSIAIEVDRYYIIQNFIEW